MRKFKFAKLVRDNIVDNIISSGNNPKYRELSNEEYIFELKRKLVEEGSELVSADENEIIKEIADIQEIIDNLIVAMKVSREKLSGEQKLKNEKNGSFKKRHYIDYVEVKDDATEIEYYLKHPDKYPEVK